jgi:hypothetical protein
MSAASQERTNGSMDFCSWPTANPGFAEYKAGPGGRPTELLPDVRALERWLIASGMVSSAKAKAVVRSWRNSAEAEAFLKQLIAFRERLRDAVCGSRADVAGDAFLSEVNSLLLQHPRPLRFASETAS